MAEGITEELIGLMAGLSKPVVARQAGETREQVAGGDRDAPRLTD